MIDDKLKEILFSWRITSNSDDVNEAADMTDYAVSQIKQIFADEGFVQMAYNPEKKEILGKPVTEVLVTEDLRTGQEFYERFDKELHFHIAPVITIDKETYEILNRPLILEAAKKASGL